MERRPIGAKRLDAGLTQSPGPEGPGFPTMIKLTYKPLADLPNQKGFRFVGVAITVKGKRIRFESTGSGRLLASGPISAATVETFVESFWFWAKCN